MLAETTSAHIEQNDIYTNFKANIALGGINSGDTMIVRNRIRESRAEGIFMLETGFCQILMNEIYGNNDGIVMTDSTCLLERNDITENARAGVICSGLSFPKITKNVIAHNLVSGVLFRDEAIADCSYNKVSHHFIKTKIDVQQLLPSVSKVDGIQKDKADRRRQRHRGGDRETSLLNILTIIINLYISDINKILLCDR